MRERIFVFVQKAIDGKKGILYCFARMVLYIFSFFFKWAVFFKNFFYDRGILKQKKVRPLVISIGNIVAGGTGKTPFTIYLANFFLKRQKKVAIISRGYGGKLKKENIVLCKSENKVFPPDYVGDEPLLMSNRLPLAYVIVGKNKVRSAKIAEELKADIIILDDGFQHRKLWRDLNFVMLGARSNHFLPRGYLRDFPKRLREADLIIGEESRGKTDLLIEKTFSDVKDKNGKKDFFQKKIGVFCAIANPRSFTSLLKKLGYEIVLEHFALDHVGFDADFLNDFALKAKNRGAEGLICTEKDFIKLKLAETLIPIYYLEIDTKIVSGEDKLIRLVAKCEKELLLR